MTFRCLLASVLVLLAFPAAPPALALPEAELAEAWKPGGFLESAWNRQEHGIFTLTSPRCGRVCSLPYTVYGEVKPGSIPLVIIPGFTEYRKQYMENAWDFMEMGFSPIFIPDLRNQGEAEWEIGKPSSFRELLAREGELEWFEREALKKVSASRPELPESEARRLVVELLDLPMGVAWIDDFISYRDDIHEFLDGFVKPRLGERKALIMGHSMGGTVAVQLMNGVSAEELPVLGYVLITPMFRIQVLGSEGFLSDVAALLAGIQSRFRPEAPLYLKRASLEAVDKYLRLYDEKNALSHSRLRKTESDHVRIREGFETVGAGARWYAQASTAMARLVNEARPAEVPVLLLTAGEELIVSRKLPYRFVDRLNSYSSDRSDEDASARDMARLVQIPGARHNLLLESDAVRELVLDEVARFLDDFALR